jgi:cytochrome c553
MGRNIPMGHVLLIAVLVGAACATGSSALGADDAILKPRVPADQINQAQTWKNPFPPTRETLEKGKQLFQGKAFCVTCHGRDGKGLGSDIEPGTLKGPLPRNFTDQKWQAARTAKAQRWRPLFRSF